MRRSSRPSRSPACWCGRPPEAIPKYRSFGWICADQALGELSQYLDRALLSGREGVEIVHGRGTGALRKEVHAFLKTFPGIASFALAPEDQGGDGVTIVTFK